jgi:endogenous inhibitor of DNA gyrase (YacG/DUF329 family)
MHRKLTDEEFRQTSGNSHASSTRKLKCSLCGSEHAGDPKLMPFCSVRCQQIDLAGWLDEEYGLPFEGDKSGQIVEFLDEEVQ